MEHKKKFIIRNKILVITAFVFAIICFAIAALSFRYYNQVKSTVKEESSDYMHEIATQIGANIDRTIENNFLALETISVSLRNSGVGTFEELTKLVGELQAHWQYYNLLVIDETGKAYDETGAGVHLNESNYLCDTIANGIPALSASEKIAGEECIVFAVPLADGFEIGNIRIKALAAAYDLETFDEFLSMLAFNGQGFSIIVDEDGRFVIKSQANQVFQGNNILGMLSDESASIGEGSSFDKISSDILDGESGFAEVKYFGDELYVSYLALSAEIGNLDWRLMTFVPVSVVNVKSGLLLQLTLMICLTIVILFALLFATLMIVTYRNRRKLEKIAYVDRITGGNTMQYFYDQAERILKQTDRPVYALVYTNIEKFKVLNELAGVKNCDTLLIAFAHGIAGELKPDECISRLFADNFTLLIRYVDENEISARIDEWKAACNCYMKERGIPPINFIVEFGVYVITNENLPISQMIDRAKLAISETNIDLRENIRLGIYDESVSRNLLREKHLEDMMESAMRNREFQVYLQPKFSSDAEKIAGAEALVRWQSLTDGMIYPDEFIPLFEKNTFIVQLDLFVFETVCRTLRTWIDEGKETVKISVNCSRVHLRNPSFLKKYEEIADRYNIPRKTIEIEFTENIVFGDVENFSQIIRRVRESGFGCSMDDFGSGYSSLSLIQDIPVDTLKLDKVFFRNRACDSAKRTESVIASIISMSKALSLTTVAEGVEEKSQVEMLRRLGCDLIQGYYYAKPMPIPDFVKMAFGEKANHGVGEN